MMLLHLKKDQKKLVSENNSGNDNRPVSASILEMLSLEQ
jgi:hypothetical protein